MCRKRTSTADPLSSQFKPVSSIQTPTMDAKRNACLAPLLHPGLAVALAGGATAIPTSLCRTPSQEPVLPAPSVVDALLSRPVNRARRFATFNQTLSGAPLRLPADHRVDLQQVGPMPPDQPGRGLPGRRDTIIPVCELEPPAAMSILFAYLCGVACNGTTVVQVLS